MLNYAEGAIVMIFSIRMVMRGKYNSYIEADENSNGKGYDI